MSKCDGLKQVYVWGAVVSVRSYSRAGPLTPVGADWANLGAFQLLHALSGCLVAKALARIRPAAQQIR